MVLLHATGNGNNGKLAQKPKALFDVQSSAPIEIELSVAKNKSGLFLNLSNPHDCPYYHIYNEKKVLMSKLLRFLVFFAVVNALKLFTS